MTLQTPYPLELIRVARKVVWYDTPEETLADLSTFLTHVMVYGTSADLAVVGATCRRKNSGACLRMRRPGYSRGRVGASGTNGLECRCPRCRVAGSRTVR